MSNLVKETYNVVFNLWDKDQAGVSYTYSIFVNYWGKKKPLEEMKGHIVDATVTYCFEAECFIDETAAEVQEIVEENLISISLLPVYIENLKDVQTLDFN